MVHCVVDARQRARVPGAYSGSRGVSGRPVEEDAMKPKATTSKTPRAPHVLAATHPRSVPTVAPAPEDVRETEQPLVV